MNMRGLVGMAGVTLTGFSCGSGTTLAVRTDVAGDRTSLAVLSAEFTSVVGAIDQWAVANEYTKQECAPPPEVTPLCKKYYSTQPVAITVTFKPTTNRTEVSIFDQTSEGLRLYRTNKSLLESLRAKGWEVRYPYGTN